MISPLTSLAKATINTARPVTCWSLKLRTRSRAAFPKILWVGAVKCREHRLRKNSSIGFFGAGIVPMVWFSVYSMRSKTRAMIDVASVSVAETTKALTTAFRSTVGSTSKPVDIRVSLQFRTRVAQGRAPSDIATEQSI
jgi:hypothetical protein